MPPLALFGVLCGCWYICPTGKGPASADRIGDELGCKRSHFQQSSSSLHGNGNGEGTLGALGAYSEDVGPILQLGLSLEDCGGGGSGGGRGGGKGGRGIGSGVGGCMQERQECINDGPGRGGGPTSDLLPIGPCPHRRSSSSSMQDSIEPKGTGIGTGTGTGTDVDCDIGAAVASVENNPPLSCDIGMEVEENQPLASGVARHLTQTPMEYKHEETAERAADDDGGCYDDI